MSDKQQTLNKAMLELGSMSNEEKMKLLKVDALKVQVTFSVPYHIARQMAVMISEMIAINEYVDLWDGNTKDEVKR